MNSKLKSGLRIFFGVICLVFGFNPFFHFVPLPPLSGDAGTLMDIYQNSGFMKFVMIFQILAALGLIFGKYIGLSLVFLVAIFFNATIFHAFHDLGGIGTSAFIFLYSLLLVYLNRDEFSSLFHPAGS